MTVKLYMTQCTLFILIDIISEGYLSGYRFCKIYLASCFREQIMAGFQGWHFTKMIFKKHKNAIKVHEFCLFIVLSYSFVYDVCMACLSWLLYRC